MTCCKGATHLLSHACCSALRAVRGLLFNHEDVNGEKLTVKKWWIFGADFFTVYAEFFTVCKGQKR